MMRKVSLNQKLVFFALGALMSACGSGGDPRVIGAPDDASGANPAADPGPSAQTPVAPTGSGPSIERVPEPSPTPSSVPSDVPTPVPTLAPTPIPTLTAAPKDPVVIDGIDERLPGELFEGRAMAANEVVPILFKASQSPRQNGAVIATQILCLDDANSMAQPGSFGMALLRGSRAVISQENGGQEGIGPFIATTCGKIKPSDRRSSDLHLSRKFELRKMRMGDAILEAPLLAAPNNQRRSELTVISCDDQATAAPERGNAGIMLLKGAKLVVTRDTSFRFSDGSRIAGSQAYSVVTCE